MEEAYIPHQTPSHQAYLFLHRRAYPGDECAWTGEFQQCDYHWLPALCRLRLALFLSHYQGPAEKEWQSNTPDTALDSRYAYALEETRSGFPVAQARVKLFAHPSYSAMPQQRACDAPGYQYNTAH